MFDIVQDKYSERWRPTLEKAKFGPHSSYADGDPNVSKRVADAFLALIAEKASEITTRAEEIFTAHKDHPSDEDRLSILQKLEGTFSADLQYADRGVAGMRGWSPEQLAPARQWIGEKGPRDRRAARHQMSVALARVLPVATPVVAPRRRLVLLLHGIRTRAEWHRQIKALFEAIPNTIVNQIGYGYFGTFELIAPMPFRGFAVQEVHRKIRLALGQFHGNFDDDELVVVAHSFGTYILARLLSKYPDFRPHRVILCGSIIKRRFQWDRLPNLPDVLNEAGRRDIWPVMAQSLSLGYGSSGTFGFQWGNKKIIDRIHDLKHSDYFQPGFAERYWVPWLKEDKVVPSDLTPEPQSRTPLWLNLLDYIELKWVFVVAVLIYLIVRRL